MLLLGTTDHLEDLDRQYTIAEDVSVDGVAPPHATAAGLASASRTASRAHVLLDGARIARVEEYEVVPVARLGSSDGQCLASADGALVVGLGGAHVALVRLPDGTPVSLPAFDEVEGRDAWENPAAPSPDLRSIAVTESGAWLANVHVGGIWRTTDGGQSWTNVVPPDHDVHEVVAGDGSRVVAAAAVGFGWSTDGGATWKWTSEGLHASYCRAVAIDGDSAYVTASTGPSGRDGRLYRVSLAAGSAGSAPPRAEQCRDGLPESFPFNLDTGSVTARGGSVALGTRDGQVWRSGDAGRSFERVTERVGHVRVLRFA